MKIFYDKEADAAYIELSRKKADGVNEISEYVNLDTTKDGEIVGIELLEASKRIHWSRCSIMKSILICLRIFIRIKNRNNILKQSEKRGINLNNF